MRWSPVGVVSLFVLAACPGDGTGLDEFGNPIGTVLPPADTVTLSGDVQPIFTANCAFSGCHAGNTPALGQNLSAGQAYGSIVNVPSQEAPDLFRVHPSFPDSSYLVHKIQGTQGSVGGSGGRMPLGGAALSADDIATIRAWISAGALNN
jgi:mono/diheme cytochrome c family protein